MKVIKTKKGLDIPIPGTAERVLTELPVEGEYAVKTTDFVGVTPRLTVSEGDIVKAGTPLFVDKHNEAARFVSPVNGTVKAIVRGDKRALLSVVVEASTTSPTASQTQTESQSREAIVDTMVETGLWTLLRQRPFGIVPQRESKPKAVFISAFDSSPLPVDIPFMLEGRKEDFQQGIDILRQLACKVHISLHSAESKTHLETIQNADLHYFEGPHPAGLVGTQIAYIDPINKGETIWTVNAQDVAIIGHLFRTGEYRPERVVALCGPCVDKPQYYHVLSGTKIDVFATFPQANHQRIICGDVLSGTAIATDGYLCASCDKVSILPEGDYFDFMGWLRPNFKKYSFSRTFLSGIISKFRFLNTKFDFDTGKHGSVRPLFVTGEFEKLTPLDIYPMQLIKACIVGDIELMENLGIYEVEPEDLALCEFADTSKTEIQAIIRAGLEKIRKELGL